MKRMSCLLTCFLSNFVLKVIEHIQLSLMLGLLSSKDHILSCLLLLFLANPLPFKLFSMLLPFLF